MVLLAFCLCIPGHFGNLVTTKLFLKTSFSLGNHLPFSWLNLSLFSHTLSHHCGLDIGYYFTKAQMY